MRTPVSCSNMSRRRRGAGSACERVTRFWTSCCRRNSSGARVRADGSRLSPTASNHACRDGRHSSTRTISRSPTGISFSGRTSCCREADCEHISDCACCRPLPRLSRVRLVIDATRNAGSETIATGRVSWSHSGEPRGAALEFTNDDPGALYEFRIHARGRPIRSRLRFFGVRIELIDGSSARFKRSELHIGEQLSLLVDLIEQRTRTLYPRDLFAGTPPRSEITGRDASAKQVVISPVSNSELRDWGTANYARLIALLLDRTDCRIVLVGSGAQHRQLERILEENGRDPRITNVAGATRLVWHRGNRPSGGSGDCQ